MNPAANDYHLLASSPAVDAGLTLTQINTDLDGNPRPQGAGYDIGAYKLTAARKQAPNHPTTLTVAVR